MHEFRERLADHFGDRPDPDFNPLSWLDQSDVHDQRWSDVDRYALQAGLAAVWNAFGVQPDVVAGWGLGQYTAAGLAGVLCFKDALILVAEREKLLRSGKVFPADQIAPGEVEAVTELNGKALDEFEQLADRFNYYPPHLPLVCSLSGELVPIHRSLGGSYWRQHCLAVSASDDVVRTMHRAGCQRRLEIGTRPTGKGALEPDDGSGFPVLSETETVTTSLFKGLGRLYVWGVNPDFRPLSGYTTTQRIGLPGYPFQKKRYWITEIDDHMELPRAAIRS
jgi:acyl transferase domain-containing protein